LAVEPHADGTRRISVPSKIVSFCAGLITVDSNIIRLVHYTTQEYFRRRYLKSFKGISSPQAVLPARKRLDTEDSLGRMPLSYAAERGNARLVEVLLDYKVDLNYMGWTPFSQATDGGSAALQRQLYKFYLRRSKNKQAI
jgi:hypothetical protein